MINTCIDGNVWLNVFIGQNLGKNSDPFFLFGLLEERNCREKSLSENCRKQLLLLIKKKLLTPMPKPMQMS